MKMPSPETIEWLACGERGLSSEAIFTHTTGMEARDVYYRNRFEHPLDPDDLRRCVRLLEAVPECRDHFNRMAECSQSWAELVKVWGKLVESLDAEAPGWRDGERGNAPKTYDMMQVATAKARELEDAQSDGKT